MIFNYINPIPRGAKVPVFAKVPRVERGVLSTTERRAAVPLFAKQPYKKEDYSSGYFAGHSGEKPAFFESRLPRITAPAKRATARTAEIT